MKTRTKILISIYTLFVLGVVGWMSFDIYGVEGLTHAQLIFIYVLEVLCLVIIGIQIWKPSTPKPKSTLKNGDHIKITYLKPCRNGQGTKNPYIGMSGVVHDLTETDFSLLTETSWLVFIDLKTCKYIYIK